MPERRRHRIGCFPQIMPHIERYNVTWNALLAFQRVLSMPTMSSKGRVTIPKRIREALGLKPGGEVIFEFQGRGEAIVRIAARSIPKSRFAKLCGSLKSGMTTDEIMALTKAH
jgi:AbrB family looped-hinge helix DNA binding protein